MKFSGCCISQSWVRSLLKEIQVPFTTPTIYSDNQSTAALNHNTVLLCRTKHWGIMYFIGEKFPDSSLHVHLVQVQDQIFDILTKPLSKLQFTTLSHQLPEFVGGILEYSLDSCNHLVTQSSFSYSLD